jgi:hypothetical protein
MLNDSPLGEINGLIEQENSHIPSFFLGYHGEKQSASGSIGIVSTAGKDDQYAVAHELFLLATGIGS